MTGAMRATPMLGLALMLIGLPAAAGAQPTVELLCEVHVSAAGVPPRQTANGYVSELKRREAEEPLSPLNVYSPVYRANTLNDELIRRLVPAGYKARIIRHPDMLDKRNVSLGKVRGPIYPTQSGCYADLVLANIISIFPNPGRNPYGVAGQALAGGNRLVSTFWFQLRESASAPMQKHSGKSVSPLPPDFRLMTNGIADQSGTVAKASDSNLQQFVDVALQQAR